MAALSHLYEHDELEREIAGTERVLSNLRGFYASAGWNAQQLEKLGWQVSACERHLERLRGLRGTT